MIENSIVNCTSSQSSAIKIMPISRLRLLALLSQIEKRKNFYLIKANNSSKTASKSHLKTGVIGRPLHIGTWLNAGG